MEWSLIMASCTLKWGRNGGEGGGNYQEQSGLRVSGKNSCFQREVSPSSRVHLHESMMGKVQKRGRSPMRVQAAIRGSTAPKIFPKSLTALIQLLDEVGGRAGDRRGES